MGKDKVDMYFAVNFTRSEWDKYMEIINNEFRQDLPWLYDDINFMVSYHYHKKKMDKIIDLFESDKRFNKIFLDSGAYSAHTQGSKIDIDEYIDFINQYHEKVNFYAELDVLSSPEESLENYIYMYDKVKEPEKLVPIYHTGERKSIIQEFNEYDYNVIGASDITYHFRPLRRKLINNVKLETDRKMHLFGITDFKLAYQYQNVVNSLDSITHKKEAGFGMIFDINDDDFTFNKIFVTDRAKYRKDYIDNIGSKEYSQNKIKHIEEKYGINFDDLREEYKYRVSFNIVTTLEIVHKLNKKESNMSTKKRKRLI
ncbi:MAG: hypothetical protein ACOCRK_11645 [bacterium]